MDTLAGDLFCRQCGLTLPLEPEKPFRASHSCKEGQEKTFVIRLKEIPKASGVSVPSFDSVTTADLSVIVVAFNNIHSTRECVDKLKASQLKFRELLIVDNGSTDGTAEWAEKIGAKVIRNLSNLGCGIARNQGAKAAVGEYLLFLDNDQFVAPQTLQRLWDVRDRFSAVGVEHWQVELDGKTFPNKSGIIRFNSYIGAGGMLVKKKIFLSVGGFDERYAPLWYEDVDFSFRLKSAGYSIGVELNAVIHHTGGTTSGHTDSQKTERRALFLKTWLHLLKDRKGKAGGRPKILMMADVRNWAWDRKAQELKTWLADKYDLDIFYIFEDGRDMSALIRSGSFDIFFTFEPNCMKRLPPELSHNERVITGVTAHTYTNMPGYQDALRTATAIHANSQLLWNEIKGFNKYNFYVPNGVNEKYFKYTLNDRKGPLTVGYVGKNTQRKGLEHFIIPACKKAGVKLMGAVGKYTDSTIVPWEKMPEFYAQVDAILIASDMDGTPNQLLEAAGVGRTFIGNRIGNVPEFWTKANGIVVDRNVEAYVAALEILKNDRKAVVEMGVAARDTVDTGWTWKHKSEDYRRMFDTVMAL